MRIDEIAPRVLETQPRPKLMRILSLFGSGCCVVFFFYEAASHVSFAIKVFYAQDVANPWWWKWSVANSLSGLMFFALSLWFLLRLIAEVRKNHSPSRPIAH
jgi:hypothetical protein